MLNVWTWTQMEIAEDVQVVSFLGEINVFTIIHFVSNMELIKFVVGLQLDGHLDQG